MISRYLCLLLLVITAPLYGQCGLYVPPNTGQADVQTLDPEHVADFGGSVSYFALDDGPNRFWGIKGRGYAIKPFRYLVTPSTSVTFDYTARLGGGNQAIGFPVGGQGKYIVFQLMGDSLLGNAIPWGDVPYHAQPFTQLPVIFDSLAIPLGDFVVEDIVLDHILLISWDGGSRYRRMYFQEAKDCATVTSTSTPCALQSSTPYPNPTNGLVYGVIEPWRLFDTAGKLYAQGDTNPDLSALPAGLYLLATSDQVHKIVKQ